MNVQPCIRACCTSASNFVLTVNSTTETYIGYIFVSFNLETQYTIPVEFIALHEFSMIVKG